ncbi:hypothetical protein GCM10010191_12420 [Actinomadura vinacea]|uniref:Uncharacterized protein n=1 Tax=Actinomadura vinacea TaxID=115336 RepID=A0ABN3IIS8_9ACTN
MSSGTESSVDDPRSTTGADRPSPSNQPDSRDAPTGADAPARDETGGLQLVAPAEPPRLTPAAARALLALLLQARARRATDHSDDKEINR